MCLLTAFSVTSFSCPVSTDPGQDSITKALVRKGYENVQVVSRNDTLFVGFENRLYRWSERAVVDVIALIVPGLGGDETISLTCLNQGIPLSTLILRTDHYRSLLDRKISAREFSDSVKSLMSVVTYKEITGHGKGINPSFNKIDISIGPLFRAQFGNFSHPVATEFSIVPSVQVNFLKGMSFTAQVILPVYNDMNDPEGKYIRPGLIVLGQSFRLPLNFFATLSAGYFTLDRYGINGEARKYFFNGKLALSASAGYTGYAGMQNGQWTYSSMDWFTWYTNASYRVSRYDLTVSAGYGKFLAGDKGWRCDISREFGEVSIGFFAMRSGNMTNGGFNFVVPLPPRVYSTKHRVRVRPASYVPWEFRAKGLPAQGQQYSTGTGIDDLYYNLNPDYLRTNLGNRILNHD